eukprot:1268623-Amorphochlora_amoeboformis.AAC.1
MDLVERGGHPYSVWSDHPKAFWDLSEYEHTLISTCHDLCCYHMIMAVVDPGSGPFLSWSVSGERSGRPLSGSAS